MFATMTRRAHRKDTYAGQKTHNRTHAPVAERLTWITRAQEDAFAKLFGDRRFDDFIETNKGVVKALASLHKRITRG
jgi:hypothetical protein